MRIAIGGDHAGPVLKKVLMEFLNSKKIEVVNHGTDSKESVDYPDFAHLVAADVTEGKVDLGILICGSANGVSMTANKHAAVRAAIAWTPEIATLARQHNNANVLCIPARFVSEETAKDMVASFLSTDFEGGRHARRVGKISCAILAIAGIIPGLYAQNTEPRALEPSPAIFANTINAEDLENHLMVLASDAFEGRETGERGADKAAAYIASHFEALGIAPYDGVSYYQPVSLIRSQINGGTLSLGGESIPFLDGFVLYPGIRDKSITEVGLVFAGWGWESDLTHDYEGLDVRGKIVIVLPGEPTEKGWSENWTEGLQEKRRWAEDRGARGLLVLGDGYDMYKSRMKPWLTRKSLRLDRQDPIENKQGTRLPTFFVDLNQGSGWMAETPLKNAKKLRKLRAKNKSLWRGDVPNAQMSFELNDSSGPVEAQNVLGFIPGRDSLLSEELVVITAHYDHVGIIKGEIYNGADDDGSGTSSVLELAEAFMEAVKRGVGPRRSVLLMTVVGEEKGLLGSEWYTEHPVWPLANTIANLNIDMIGRTDEAHGDNDEYVYIIGSDKLSTELHKINEAANNKWTGLALDYTFNAPDDPNRFYYRSDHYNFAKNNIPVIFYFTGVHEDYHKPGDDPEKILYPKTARIGQLVFHTAWQLANQNKRIEVDSENDFPVDR